MLAICQRSQIPYESDVLHDDLPFLQALLSQSLHLPEVESNDCYSDQHSVDDPRQHELRWYICERNCFDCTAHFCKTDLQSRYLCHSIHPLQVWNRSLRLRWFWLSQTRFHEKGCIRSAQHRFHLLAACFRISFATLLLLPVQWNQFWCFSCDAADLDNTWRICAISPSFALERLFALWSSSHRLKMLPRTRSQVCLYDDKLKHSIGC